MEVTFPISPEVEPGKLGTYKQVETAGAIKGISGVDVEACGGNLTNLIAHPNLVRREMHGFLRAVYGAFANHFPLVLSPDDVWLVIAQGFAHHVNAHAEKLRSKFVKHQGQEYIEVRRDNFRKGSPDNDWPGAFAEFSDKIAEHIGDDKRRMVVNDFSSTGAVEKAASEVVLMDAMKAYFTYGMRTMCGIPNMTLLGTRDDWAKLRERVKMFKEYDAEDWAASLDGVLGHFEETFKGNADPEFWQSFYNQGGGSGGPYVTGAINAFFPYLPTRGGGYRSNHHALKWSEGIGSMGGGPNVNDFPMGISSVPFVWHYYSAKYDMSFLGGFIGTSQDPTTGALRPAIGWGIADRAKAD